MLGLIQGISGSGDRVRNRRRKEKGERRKEKGERRKEKGRLVGWERFKALQKRMLANVG